MSEKEICKLMALAIERQKNDLKRLPKLGYYFDDTKVKRVVSFFEKNLKHSKGQWAGENFKLLDWQVELVIKPLFGWMRPDGTRRFRQAYIELPRKNGKSTLYAGIGNYCFIADHEPGAEVYTAATKMEQAKIIHNEAVRMVEASPKLQSLVEIYRENMNIITTASKFEPLGADAGTLDGLNVHCALLDELHAHKKRLLYDVIITASAARRQPLIASITTAGWDIHSICYELHRYAESILTGIMQDDNFFTLIANADQGDDWRDKNCWFKANPSLGHTIKVDYLEAECQKAERMTSFQNTFKRLHLNIWTEQEERWLDTALWQACTSDIDPKMLEGRTCFGGLDLSTVSDITAFSLVFPLDDGRVFILPKFWVPSDTIVKRQMTSNIPYHDWSLQGFLTKTQGSVTDYDVVRKDINNLRQIYDIREVSVDRWNATQLSTQLQGDGLELVQMGQGFASMSAPSKLLEILITSSKLGHFNNPVMNWMVGNVATETDAAGNIKPSKKRSPDKIDGVVATVMGLDRALRRSQIRSIYETRGLTIL